MRSRSLLPGPSELPLVGSLFAFRRDPPGFFTNLHSIYGDAASFTLMGTRLHSFASPRAVKYVLVDNPRNFTQREVYPELSQLVGDGLLTLDGAEHRQQRRVVQPAFHRSRIEAYAATMVRRTRGMLADWHVGQEIDVARAMRDLTLGIAGETMFDVRLEGDSDAIGAAFLTASEFVDLPRLSPGSLPINLPFTPYGRFRRARRWLDRVVEDIIARRRAEGRDHGDVLSMLLAATDDTGGILADEQVRDHVLTFLAAGHATTANALDWTFYLLSQNPPVAGKLAEELSDTLAGRDPTVDDLARLSYLEQVVKEALRLFPPAWVQLRKAVDDCEIDGWSIPAGAFVAVSQWVLHRRPDLWRDAEQFIPERFDPAGGEEPRALSYFPFGAGPRTCIGMPFALLEARLVLATVLQRFQPILVPGFPVEPRALVILQPRHGLRMRLETARVSRVGVTAG